MDARTDVDVTTTADVIRDCLDSVTEIPAAAFSGFWFFCAAAATTTDAADSDAAATIAAF